MGGAEFWDVDILPSAEKERRSLPAPEREEVRQITRELLAEDPLSAGKPLRNYNRRFKIRFGRGERYRPFYEVYPSTRRVIVTKIEQRGPGTYRGMDKW